MEVYICVCVCMCVGLHAMEYDSAIKRTTWIDLETVDLGEINLYRKTSTLCFHLYVQSNNRNSYS